MASGSTKEALYEDVTEELLSREGVERSTMMGFPCMRLDGAFFASLDTRNHDLIVKLPADRVAELVSTGEGAAFAPAGKVFREWVAIDSTDDDQWRRLLEAAIAFAAD